MHLNAGPQHKHKDNDVTEADLEAVDELIAAGKNAEALKVMRTLFARAPEDPTVFRGMMVALHMNCLYRETIKVFEAAPPEISSSDVTSNIASNAYVHLGNFVAAEQTIERALQLDPNNHEYVLNDAIAKINLRKFDVGTMQLSKFIEARPNDARGYQIMAERIQKHPLYSTAEENISKMIYYGEKAFQLDPKRFRGRIVLAWCYFGMKQYDKWLLTMIGKWPVKEGTT